MMIAVIVWGHFGILGCAAAFFRCLCSCGKNPACKAMVLLRHTWFPWRRRRITCADGRTRRKLRVSLQSVSSRALQRSLSWRSLWRHSERRTPLWVACKIFGWLWWLAAAWCCLRGCSAAGCCCCCPAAVWKPSAPWRTSLQSQLWMWLPCSPKLPM